MVGATGKTLKALLRRDEALSEADNAIDKTLDFIRKGVVSTGKKGTEYFKPERQTIGLKRADIKLAQRISRDLNLNIDGMFPYIKRTFSQNKLEGREQFLKLLNDALVEGAPKYVRPAGKQPAKVVFVKISKSTKKKIADFMNKSNNDVLLAVDGNNFDIAIKKNDVFSSQMNSVGFSVIKVKTSTGTSNIEYIAAQ